MNQSLTDQRTFFAVLVILLIGSWNLSAQTVAPPANDNFANAIAFGSCCMNINGTNLEATKEVGEPNHAGNMGGHSVWYKFTYSISYVAGFTVTTRRSAAPFDTLLAVYTGSSVNALTPIASNDDFGSTPIPQTSTLYFQAIPGTTYYFAVDGFAGATGNFTISLDINRTHAESSRFAGTIGSLVSVFRPSNGNWYVTSNSGTQTVHWGANGDIPVPADYDGDEVTDFAVFRPSDGNWHVLQSLTSTYRALHWGQNGDKPVPGDYLLANGFAQYAVFRPSNGTWYATTPFGTTGITQFGANGDKPVPRDFDSDGKQDFSVFRPSTGTWYIRNSRDGSFRIQQWGISEDIPVPGGYIATGNADIAVWRPSNGNWYIYYVHNNSYEFIHFGQSGDIPQPIDYGSVNGLSDFGIYRPSNGVWYIQEKNGPFYAFQFGLTGDIPTMSPYPIQP